jgi:hypothetical protein
LSATDPMHLSEAELRAMTSDLDAIHHDVALPALKTSLAEWAEDIHAQAAAGAGGDSARAVQLGRRRFLTGAGAVAGAVGGAAVLAACSSSSSSSAAAGSSSSRHGDERRRRAEPVR